METILYQVHMIKQYECGILKLKKEIKVLKWHSSGIRNVQFSADGQMIVSASDDCTILQWDAKSGKMLKSFEGYRNIVMKAQFFHDGKFILSCSDDATIRIWDVESGKELKKLKGHSDAINDVKYFSDS
ncbi:hypothetical protein RFI_38437 [Reticulomyxa filosa]|uniref:Uncharacterized protein n=1 Tax=Reticulomyxa filosa TaxID=46433 RepID=X6LCG6_RETFI|nr:hypothetical protein RFI_38437 [Reticulomyxa filosa]|eukprot:ETN99050.1 hypothetical protein RFI_38437 [Reticulomyxa filosa]